MPKEGGLLDLRLGTTERGLNCATCGCSELYCPGHFGHIELAKPVYHIGFMPFLLKVHMARMVLMAAQLCATVLRICSDKIEVMKQQQLVLLEKET